MTEITSIDAPSGRTALLADGWGKLRGGDRKGALAVADALVAIGNPLAPELLFAGETHFALGNFRGTDKLASRAIELFPEDISARVLKMAGIRMAE